MSSNSPEAQDILRLFKCVVDTGADVIVPFAKHKLLKSYNGNFERFLDDKKHKIFHIWQSKKLVCCECPPAGYNLKRSGYMDNWIFKKLYEDNGKEDKGHIVRNNGKLVQVCIHKYVTKHIGVYELDISAISCLLRNLAALLPNENTALDTITTCRSQICHAYSMNCYPMTLLNTVWTKLENALVDLTDPSYKGVIKKQIKYLRKVDLDKEEITELLKNFEEVNKMVLALLLFCKASAIPYPDIDASLDELVVYYTSFSFTTKEVLGILLNIHHIMLSERSFYRIKKRLRLQKRGVESAIADIVKKKLQLRNARYTNIGYRSLWNILHCLGVIASQHTVRLVLKAIDGDGVLRRQRHRLTRRRYTSNGPSFCIHVDGYDKLKPFGISVHGGIDGFSRKILWLKATSSNKNPRIVAGHFLEYLKTSKRVPRVVRMDAGTENVIVERIQIALRSFHNDSMEGHRSVSIGRSTANQKIEMLWSFLMRNFTTFWRNLFKDMVDEGILNNADPVHLECIRFCFLPLIQRHLDMFLQSWNSHRIRSQRNVECPHGIPDVMYYQPFIYDKYDCSYELPCDIVVLNYLTDIYTDAVLPRGTKEEFRQLINTLTFLDIEEFDVIETPTQAKELFNLLSGVISQHLLNR